MLKSDIYIFEWKKLGRIFDPTSMGSHSWMKEYAQSPSVLIFEKHIRVYFCTRPAADDKGQYMSYIGYVDLNRDNLIEVTSVCKDPVMQLGGLGTFDEFGTNPASVIRDGEEVRIYYAGLTNKWIKNEGKPEPVYKIRMAYSDDGINWKKHGKDLIENKLEENECQASPDIFFWKGKYHMFFCYRYNFGFKKKEKGYRIGYASSDDLVNWIRNDAKAGLDISDEGWDSETVSYPHVFELDNKIYMFYQGNEMGRYGFGLAELVNK